MIEFMFGIAMFILFASAAPMWLAAAGAFACYLMARKWGTA